MTALRQPRLFVDNIPRSKDARRGLWIEPTVCPHLEEDETFTVWAGEDEERMTYTCVNCGRVRGRATAERRRKPAR